MIRRMSAGHSATTAAHHLLQAYADSAGAAAPDFSIGPFRDDITVVQYVVVAMLLFPRIWHTGALTPHLVAND